MTNIMDSYEPEDLGEVNNNFEGFNKPGEDLEGLEGDGDDPGVSKILAAPGVLLLLLIQPRHNPNILCKQILLHIDNGSHDSLQNSLA